MTPADLLLTSALLFLGIAVLNAVFWPKLRRAPPANEPVSILIPARNEEANLPACLASVLSQGRSVAEILVYDDHSTDDTAGVIHRYSLLDARVSGVAAVPLAAGWCGKNFACAQLAAAATGQWLLFIDADARLAAGAVDRMIGEARRRDLKLLSCWPRLEMKSFWERVLMPMLNFVVYATFPAPLSLVRPEPSLGVAHGACLLFERATYRELGGHAAVRDQIFEDVRLAQHWRRNRKRALCLDGQEVVSVRMYSSLAEIWRGFQKNFYPAFKRETGFWLFLAIHFTVFLLPFLWLTVAPGRKTVMAAGAVLLTRFVLAVRFRHPLWSPWLHPVAETILLALGISSWWRCKSGQGVEWRGRRYQR